MASGTVVSLREKVNAKFLDSLSTLEAAIFAIYDDKSSCLSFEELYRHAYSLVLHRHGGELYQRVCSNIQAHLEKTVCDLKKKLMEYRENLEMYASTDNGFEKRPDWILDQTTPYFYFSCPIRNRAEEGLKILSRLLEMWKKHKIATQLISDVLMYMERNYVTKNKRIPVMNIGSLFFRHIVLFDETVLFQLSLILKDIFWLNLTSANKNFFSEEILLNFVVMLIEVDHLVTKNLSQDRLSNISKVYDEGRKEAARIVQKVTSMPTVIEYIGGLLNVTCDPESNVLKVCFHTKSNMENEKFSDKIRHIKSDFSIERFFQMFEAYEPGDQKWSLETAVDKSNYIQANIDKPVPMVFFNQVSFSEPFKIYQTDCIPNCTAILNRFFWEHENDSLDDDFTYSLIFEYNYFLQLKSFIFFLSNLLSKILYVPQYIKMAENHWVLEIENAKKITTGSTLIKLHDLHEAMWIDHHWTHLIHSQNFGCAIMFQKCMFDDLERMYRLCKRLPGRLKEMQMVIHQEIIKEVRNISASESGKVFHHNRMTCLVDLRIKCNRLVKESFYNSRSFVVSMRQAFEQSLAEDNRFARGLCDFFHIALSHYYRYNLNYDSSEIINFYSIDVCDALFEIFRFLNLQDTFQAAYEEKLSERLMFVSEIPLDLEQICLNRFKDECGNLFTLKMEGMLNDATVSKEENKEFNRSERREIEADVKVLNSTNWNVHREKIDQFIVPNDLSELANEYKKFYTRKYMSRRLDWIMDYGCVIIEFTSTDEVPRTLVTSGMQSVVLLQFNNYRSITVRTLQVNCGLSFENIVDVLTSLSDLLSVYRNSEKIGLSNISSTDVTVLSCNSEEKMMWFSDTCLPHKKALSGDLSQEEKPVIDDTATQFAIEACIMRQLKAEKEMSIDDLFEKVTLTLNPWFDPERKTVQTRLDKLVEREFVARTDKETPTYKYVP